MKLFFRFLIFLVVSVLISSSGIQRVDFRHGIKKNVCKDLRNDALAYIVFVDSKETSPWTEFDIRSTLDSINIAVNWINQQALKNKINLKQLLKNFHPSQVFITTAVKPYLAKAMKDLLSEKNIPFVCIGDSGAYEMEL